MPNGSSVPTTVTSGFFQVAQLPAAQVVSVRLYFTNVESQPATVQVRVHRLVLGQKREILSEEIEVPAEGQHILELGSELVEGESIEVLLTLPTDGFVPGQSGVVPGVAIVSFFVGDQTTSLLQWISADDFISLGEE